MSANLSGNNIDNGDFMIKTCAADPEGGYAKEKFHADPKNGVIINEVDGAKGKCLEFSADWSVVSLDTKLQKGDNIEIGEDQQTGKLEISAPDVGKVLVDPNDTTLKYLDEAINSPDGSIHHETSNNLENLTVPNLGKVKHEGSYKDLVEGSGISLVENGDTLEVTANILEGTGITITNNVGGSKTISATNNGKVFVNSSDSAPNFLDNKIEVYFPLQTAVFNNSILQIRVLDKLNFAQFNAKWLNGDYDKSDISAFYEYSAVLGKIYCSNADVFGVCFAGNLSALRIRYTATSDVDCILYYRIIGEVNWESQSVTLSNSSGKIATTSSFEVAGTGTDPLEFLLVCEEDTGVNIGRIFEIYAV